MQLSVIVNIFVIFFGLFQLVLMQNAITKEYNTTEKSTSAISTLSTTSSTRLPTAKVTTPKSVVKSPSKTKLVCPGKEIRRPFFSLPCRTTKDCRALGKNNLCCEGRCMKGVAPPTPEPSHSPLLFGLVERVCPAEPIPEILNIQECTTDEECTPRICCPEKMLDGVVKGFCRTAEPKFDRLPGAQQFFEPVRALMGYMQCTPPPPPVLDVFPKLCNSPLDCFPNLCCQERGRKVCRPPKRSLFALVATVGQRLVPEEAARNFISRISR